MAKMVALGAAVQDVFLSHSDALKPVTTNGHAAFSALELGAKADVNNITFSTGGGATNASVTFARFGHESMVAAVIGNDPAGQAVERELDDAGVDTSLLKVSQHYHTGYSTLLLAPNGERTILTYRGASTHFSPSQFDISDTGADWLYVSTLSGSMDTLHHIFSQARTQGTKIFFNPGKNELKQRDKLLPLLEDVEVLLLNSDEAAMIVTEGTADEMLGRLRNHTPTVLMTDGPEGLYAVSDSTYVRAGLYEDVPVVDRTGAGDAFGAGFLAKYATGATFTDSIVYGSANASSVVARIGAKAGIITQNVNLHEMPLHTNNTWQRR